MANQVGMSPASKRRQRGAVIAEFGVLVPVFLLMLIGVIDFGRIVFAYSTLTHAAGAAARYASVHSQSSAAPTSGSDVARRAREAAQVLDSKAVKVQTVWSPSNVTGGTVRVRLDYEMSLLTPLPFKKSVLLSGTAEMRISS